MKSIVVVLFIASSIYANDTTFNKISKLLNKSKYHAGVIKKGGFFLQAKNFIAQQIPTEISPSKELADPKDLFVPQPTLLPPPPAPRPAPPRRHTSNYVKLREYYEYKSQQDKIIYDLEKQIESLAEIAMHLQSQSEGHDDRFGFVVKIMGSSGFAALMGLLGTIFAIRRKKKRG